MKKNLNTQGFVMSELLAGSIVILLLFSILFANYLPLVGEFETRIAYNNVTANYAAFYIRKVYKTVLEDNAAKTTLDTGLSNQGYYVIYNSKDPNTINLKLNFESDITNIIEKYQIEEIIITKYKTDEVKGRGSYFSKRYKKNDGGLYRYIKYLPYYSMSMYDGKTSEPYRLIIKTKYGFATTQILPDPPTPISCFQLKYFREHEFTITEYDKNCGENVVITANEITVGTGSNARKGVITSITGTEGANKKGAFEGASIKNIRLSSKVTDIGWHAFKNNNIRKFSFEDNAPSVVNVGKEAFSGNLLTQITIPGTLREIGEGAFANNYNLKSIEFDFEDTDNPISYIPNNMFALEDYTKMNSDNLIDLFIPANIQTIGENAFHNIQFSSIEFENNLEPSENQGETADSAKPSKLRIIGKGAFSVGSDNANDPTPINATNYIALSLPQRIEKIEDEAFLNVKLGSLEFQVNESGESKLTEIENKAFSVYETDISKINTADFCNNGDNEEGATAEPCEYQRNITVPIEVRKIGEKAFANQQLSSIEFDYETTDGSTIYSKLTHIGDEAFIGNNLETIVIPSNLSVQEATIGQRIFGSNYTLGNDIGEISTQVNMFAKPWWCKALFGTTACVTEQVDDSSVYSYTNGNITKYVTYEAEEGD